MWRIVEEFLNGRGQDMNEILQVLADFVELSPLGEFSERLSILKSFHGHILIWPKPFDAFAMRIWNLWRFYKQFEEPVEKRITEVTAPVVKKLEEFVKICKWHTISYFSLTEATTKSHRTLLKFIKEYEKLLTDKVELLTLDPTCEEQNQDFSAVHNNSRFQFEGSGAERVVSLAGEKFPKPRSILKKTQKFCKESASNASYCALIESVDDLVGQVISNLDHFGKIAPDSTLTPEKQKSQAKSIQQQKRRALADLFQVLTRLGLSYRAGLLGSTWSALDLSKGPPFTSAGTKGKFSAEDYCMKAFARFLRLQQKLLTPSKEIGPPIIDRIRGFSAQLLNIMEDLHETLDLASAQRASLEDMAKSFEEFSEYSGIPNQVNLETKLTKFKKIAEHCLYGFKQFEFVLQTWPEKIEIDTFALEGTPDLLTSSKNDEPFQKMYRLFSKTLEILETIAKKLENSFPSRKIFTIVSKDSSIGIVPDKMKIFTENHEKILMECFKNFEVVLDNVAEIHELAGGDNPVFESLNVTDFKIDFENLKNEPTIFNQKSDASYQKILEKTENAVQSLLIGVQKVTKRVNTILNVSKEEENENSGDLLENHLTIRLVQNLKTSFNDLGLENVEKIFSELLKEVGESGGSGLLFLKSVTPFLEPYLALCDFFIDQTRATYRSAAKFTSVLLGVFLLVAEKGYCLPPELEGEGLEGEAGNGFGLGEGEGKTDVSDRIESEDQLEDARPEGEKREENDQDCPEEDKGIETSQDFGGKAQDLKENEDKDSGEEMDDEEPDKEMGETETGAEQLDKEMWDSEDENDQGNEDLPEDQGGGEKFGEDEFGANEEEGGKKEKNDKKDITDVNKEEEDPEHIDPNHGDLEPPPEPEPMELPDNIELDDEGGEQSDGEENPFDIDEMKDPELPEEKTEEMEANEEKNEEETASNNEEDNGEEGNEDQGQDEDKGDEKMEGDGPEGEPEAENPDRDSQFQPSDDKPSESAVQAAPESSNAENQSKDKIAGENGQNDELNPQENSEEQKNKDAGTGQADLDQSNAGHDAKAAKQSASQPSQETRKRSNRPGKSDEDRSLGDQKHSDAKRMRTVEKDDREGVEDDSKAPTEVDLVQHSKDGKMEALDTATEV